MKVLDIINTPQLVNHRTTVEISRRGEVVASGVKTSAEVQRFGPIPVDRVERWPAQNKTTIHIVGKGD